LADGAGLCPGYRGHHAGGARQCSGVVVMDTRHIVQLRHHYRAGWAWGLVCGLVAGICTTGLLVLLVQAALQG